MMAERAQYLLRFDDLCPTMAWDRFKRFIPVMERFGVQPILAVVPENCDPELEESAADPEFWSRMRTMQAAGATIGLHGYRHICNSRGRGFVALHATSEFAGVPEEMQERWIRAGLGILRGHGLNPGIWVAPRHGFDQGTLRVLRNEGVDSVSDGFARFPFKRGGLTWIPQQLWGPVEKHGGVWTICIHSSTATDSAADEIAAFVSKHAAQFTSVERVLCEFEAEELDVPERLHAMYALGRLRFSRLRKRLLRRV